MQPKIKFIFDRKKVSDKRHKGVIELRIYYNGMQKYISTGFSVYPSEWSDGETVKGCPEAMEINMNLAEIKKKVIRVINEMLENDCFDINEIQNRTRGKAVDMTFIQYVFKRIQERNVKDNTLKAYGVFYSKLCEYGKINTFNDLTQKNIMDFDAWLHNYTWTEKDKRLREIKRKYSQATIGSFHKNLKAFIADAVIDGYALSNPYVSARIKIDKGGTRIDDYLTPEEIEKIRRAEMPTRSLSEAKDLFLIQCDTGLSFADLMTFNFEKCRNASDFDVFSDYRVKTGVLYTFVLTPKAKEILEKYDFCVPKLPNQKYNVKLKLVADAAGLDKSISSHDGRRSCGTLLLNAGVPIAVVSRILGHSSIKQTEQAYAKLMDETIAEEVKKHIK